MCLITARVRQVQVLQREFCFAALLRSMQLRARLHEGPTLTAVLGSSISLQTPSARNHLDRLTDPDEFRVFFESFVVVCYLTTTTMASCMVTVLSLWPWSEGSRQCISGNPARSMKVNPQTSGYDGVIAIAYSRIVPQ